MERDDPGGTLIDLTGIPYIEVNHAVPESPFDKFKSLAAKLIAVPKSEIDKK
jgi:hypothetical protein